MAVKRLGTILPPHHRKLQISEPNKDMREGERLGFKFFNRKKTLDRDFTSIVGDVRKMFHRPLALQPTPKPDFLFLLTLNIKIRCIWAMVTFDLITTSGILQ